MAVSVVVTSSLLVPISPLQAVMAMATAAKIIVVQRIGTPFGVVHQNSPNVSGGLNAGLSRILSAAPGVDRESGLDVYTRWSPIISPTTRSSRAVEGQAL
jgi:hypothetical protein